ncbi:MAG: cytochrome C [Deltaproteobacteria bacterium]|nr:cytochrome C [Deltaproteobacteria bacterium]TLN04687.1 MAG: cytochrome C [bacterium]
MWRKILGYSYNLISLAGILLAIAGAALMVIFLAIGVITGIDNPYLGILIYFAFPGILVCGLLLVPIGILRTRKKMLREGITEVPLYPVLDLNDRHQRFKAIFFIFATLFFLLILAIASIKGYDYTESTEFCGKVCHTVMEPEYVAWSNSPHARVRCAECHIGPGAEWFVKAKISGLEQVYRVLSNTYPTPIETPIPNLRPARDTCEGCHWPDKFYSGKGKNFLHFASDEKNTPREVNLLLNLGKAPKTPHASGIHWHISSEVYYIARDAKRQDIPYIAVKGKDGTITEYQDVDKPLSRKEIDAGTKRLMDCIDCHNRPSHIYNSPGTEIDESFVSGTIDSSLPYIRKVAVELLAKEYKTTAEATGAIASGIRSYYAKDYPELSKAKASAIEQAILEVQKIYRLNFFPQMKVSWTTHANNIGHFYFPGCFRCHDGKHRSADGKAISRDCNLCHEVLGQKQENIKPGTKVSEFIHPVDIGDELQNTGCHECHQPAES